MDDPNVTNERQQRAAALFRAALEHDEAKRAQLLREQCGDDQAMLMEVQALLSADAAAAGFLEPPGTVVDREGPGATIGRYTLLKPIGEGGFGAVYLAEQREPVQRQVALKIIKLGMDTRQVIGRFETERQALAMMDHPNIARVFDAGATDAGRPYFVMELVLGESITDYCDRERLPIGRRLELFRQVCAAVQHAHQKGIIHRDLKPNNVLVTIVDGVPVPKVIDFGIAKATTGRLTEKTVLTEMRQLLGTPQYMSPEQAAGASDDIDTRSDIYSLGVLLYELLTGTTPFDSQRLRDAAIGDLQRMILEEEPRRPSTRVSTLDTLPAVAAQRLTEPRKLSTQLRGDLDWIVMKCLEKDRALRYASAADLAGDLHRSLTHQPITARPRSLSYQLRTMARRNKALVGGVAAVFAVLTIALAVVSSMAIHIHRQSVRRAEINAFLESLLIAGDAHPFVSGENQPRQFGAKSLWVDVIDDAVKRLDANGIADREAEAAIRHRVGMIYFWMCRFDQSYDNLWKAYLIRSEEVGEADASTLDTRIGLAFCKIWLGDHIEAERWAMEAVADCKREFGSANVRTLNSLHALYIARLYLDYLDDLAVTAREMMDIVDGHPKMAYPRSVPEAFLGFSTLVQGRLDEAEALLRQAIIRADTDSPGSLTQAWTVMALGWVYEARGELEQAEEQVRKGRDMWMARSGPHMVEFDISVLTLMCKQPSRRDEGLATLRQTVDAVCERYGEDHAFTSIVAAQASEGYVAAEQWGQAEAALRLAMKFWNSPRHVWLQRDAILLLRLGHVLHMQGKLDDAEAAFRRAIDVSEKFTDERWRRHPASVTAHFRRELATFYDQQGRHEEADAVRANVH